jgi:hypothetical protein
MLLLLSLLLLMTATFLLCEAVLDCYVTKNLNGKSVGLSKKALDAIYFPKGQKISDFQDSFLVLAVIAININLVKVIDSTIMVFRYIFVFTNILQTSWR